LGITGQSAAAGIHTSPIKGCANSTAAARSHTLTHQQVAHSKLLYLTWMEMFMEKMSGVGSSLEVLLLLDATSGPVDSCALDVGSCNIDGDFGEIDLDGVIV